jgi:hypothetical protein
MSILWCGGEDIDFNAGVVAPSLDTSTTHFRPTYARCAIADGTTATSIIRGTPFPAGAVTSCWFSCQWWTGSVTASRKHVGFAKSGTNACLVLSTAASSTTRAALSTYDGTTLTELVSEAGNSIPNNTLVKLDIQLVSYGASATVNIYFNGANVISFSGNVTVLSNTSVDQIVTFGQPGGFNSAISEVIVADEDTRAFPGLMTMALTGAGTTDNWTGIFSTINQVTFSDTTPNFTNTAAQDQQFNITDLVSGTFVIKAVKVAARMAVSATPTATQVKLGYNSGGSVAFGTGATKTLTTAYATYEQLDATNPVTAAAWAQSDMNALQLDMRSA